MKMVSAIAEGVGRLALVLVLAGITVAAVGVYDTGTLSPQTRRPTAQPSTSRRRPHPTKAAPASTTSARKNGSNSQ